MSNFNISWKKGGEYMLRTSREGLHYDGDEGSYENPLLLALIEGLSTEAPMEDLEAPTSIESD